MPATETEFEPRVGPSLWIATKCPHSGSPPARVTWTPTLLPGYIVGQVLGARTGDPLPQITVQAESFESDSYAEAITDDLGRFRVGPLQAQETFALTAVGFCYSSKAMEVTVPSAGLLQNIQLWRAGGLKGKVVDARTGAPISGAVVTASQAGADYAAYEIMETDADGSYGTCSLDASPEGFVYALMAQASGFSMVYGKEVTIVTPTGSSVVPEVQNFVLPDEVTVSGRIVRQNSVPIEHCLVRITPKDTFSIDYAEVETDSDGRFTFSEGSVDEVYIILFDPPRHGLQSVEIALTSTVPVQVLVQASQVEYIEGTVRDADTGAVIEGATVTASKGDSICSSVSDANGYYLLDRLSGTGNYQLSATAHTVDGYSAYGPVSVPLLEATASYNIGLMKSGGFSGRVTGISNGEPMVAASVRAYSHAIEPVLIGVTSSDENGEYLLTGLDAPATVSVQAQGQSYGLSTPVDVDLIRGTVVTGVNFSI